MAGKKNVRPVSDSKHTSGSRADEVVPAVVGAIESVLPKMSRAEAKVASFIVDHPDQVFELSVAGLADASGVSDATVIRACRALGFGSYQEMKIALARDIVNPIQMISAPLSSEDTPQTVIDKVFVQSVQTLQYTQRLLQHKTMTDAAAVLRGADRILIFASGGSAATGLDLRHKLLRLGLPAAAYSDAHMQEIAASGCRPGCVVVAISHSGSSVDVVDSARHAREKGAVVIGLTKAGKSPLSKIADHLLTTASPETQLHVNAISSRIAQMAIIDCLYTLIAIAMPGVSERFYEIEKALESLKY